jgi:hypothetical protein
LEIASELRLREKLWPAEIDGEVVAVEVEQTPGRRQVREDVMVGDILRGTSAVVMQQAYPTMNLMFGGG